MTITAIKSGAVDACGVVVAHVRTERTLVEVRHGRGAYHSTGAQHGVANARSHTAVAVNPAHSPTSKVALQQPAARRTSARKPSRVAKYVASIAVILAHLNGQRVPSIIALDPILEHRRSANVR